MNSQEHYEKLLSKYISLKDNRGGWKIKARNALFESLNPFIERWVKGFFHKKKVWRDKGELTSLCWFCFLHGLDNAKECRTHKGVYTVLGHFYRYTTFYLSEYLTCESKRHSKELFIEDFDKDEIITKRIDAICDVELSHECLEIKKFSGLLSSNYLKILEDVLCDNHIPNEERRTMNRYKVGQYDGAKKVLKAVVKYFLYGEEVEEKGKWN